MGVTKTYDDEGRHVEPSAAPTVVASIGDRCSACGGRLASDQRYCVTCGERRGKARFSLSSMAAPAAEAAPASPTSPRRPSLPPSASLITGIATLLLAMGVGVLIGRSGNDSGTRASAPVQVITAGGSGGVAAGTGGRTSAKTAKDANEKVKHAAISKKTAAKAQEAAAKVIGGHNLPPPTVKVGQKGRGPGYKNGQFTGDYFGQ